MTHRSIRRPLARPLASARVAGLLVLAGVVVLAGCSGGPAPASGSGATAKAAGSGGASGWHPAKPDTNGPIVAIVAGRKITRHDVDSLIALAPADVQSRIRTPEGYRQVVDRLVIEEALLAAANRAHVEDSPEYKVQVASAARTAKMRVYYNQRTAAVPPPSDSTVHAYYEEHIADYKVPARARVRHILLASQADAASLRRKLVGGALWDATCKARSKDAATKDRGGLLGYVSQESDIVAGVGKAPALVAAAFDIKEGEISQPVKSEKGWHLIKVDNREAASVQPFEQVSARLRNDLADKQMEDFSTRFTDSLRTAANATIFDDSIQVALLPAKSAQDLFKEAQAAPNPADRIALYRRVVKQFPNDSVAVQARFMIGFTYAEDLGDSDEAKAAFEEFLKFHPNSELAASARWMMENMDKPPPPLEDDGAPADSATSAPGGKASPSHEKAPRSP